MTPATTSAPGSRKVGARGERHAELEELLPVAETALADILALDPVVIFGAAEDIAGIGEGRLAAFDEAGDVIGMAVGEDDDVDVLRRIAGGGQQGKEPADAVLAAELAIARIEEDQLAAGVEDGRRISVLEHLRRQAVGDAEGVNLLGGDIRAEARMRTLALGDAVEDVGQLEIAELEAVDLAGAERPDALMA